MAAPVHPPTIPITDSTPTNHEKCLCIECRPLAMLNVGGGTPRHGDRLLEIGSRHPLQRRPGSIIIDARANMADVRPLTRERFADLAALFAEGGDPKWCWCTYFRFRGRDWTNSTASDNRAALRDWRVAIRPPAWSPTATVEPSAGSASGRARTTSGCATRRSSLRSTTRPSGRSSASSSRAGLAAQGVATLLLGAAIEYARAHGATTLEAYPVDTVAGRVRGRECLCRHPRHVRTSRLHRHRAPPMERDHPGPSDREARLDCWLSSSAWRRRSRCRSCLAAPRRSTS